MTVFIHASAEVSEKAVIGDGTKIWAFSQIREGAQVGQNCIIGRNVFVDADVTIGNDCKIQNNALLYEGLTLEDGVFIGPAVCTTNDKLPRAINPDGKLKAATDWMHGKILIKYGASVGAQAVLVTGITLGRFCLIGSGSVVTRDVPDFGLVIGQPGQVVGYVCRCARRLNAQISNPAAYICPNCARKYVLHTSILSEV